MPCGFESHLSHESSGRVPLALSLFYTLVEYIDQNGDRNMARFFVKAEELEQNTVILTGENAQHAKVLRLKAGEEVLLCDGEGREALCRMVDLAEMEVLERRESASEAAVRVSVYLAFPKADKLEHVIQKATELGAYEIVAFPSARCISKPDDKSLKKKLERWQKIAASAAEQSGRGRIPQVRVLGSYKEALQEVSKADKPLMFYENEQAVTLKMALSSGSYQTVSLLTGPEGGLEEKEVDQAREAGLQVCTLGKRILRCETAPLCALSAVMYDAGEF